MSAKIVLHMRSIDDIDVEYLPIQEVKARKIAQKVSLLLGSLWYGFAVFILAVPSLLLGGQDGFLNKFLLNLIVTIIVKPARFVVYKFIYLIAKLIIR